MLWAYVYSGYLLNLLKIHKICLKSQLLMIQEINESYFSLESSVNILFSPGIKL